MSARGFLFTAKRVAPLRHSWVSVDTRSPGATLHDHPAPGRRAVLCGPDRVEIRDSAGQLLEARDDPRAAFTGLPWKRWDAVDFGYFCGYAMWNYLTLPFLLTSPGVRCEVAADPGGGIRVDVGFPAEIPTHSPAQRLYFDAAGRLRRHDYTAEVVGGWATAVHLCSDYRRFGGLWLPTTRRVYPRGPFGRPLPGPTLVAIDIHQVRIG